MVQDVPRSATKEKAVAKRSAISNQKYEAYKDVIRDQGVKPGDIVTITTDRKSYDFKVCEIDYNKGRLKGFDVHTSYNNVGSRMGWVNYQHPDVAVKLKQKKAFDVALDACYNAHKDEAAVASEKRATTRNRRKALRDIYGI